MSKVMKEPAIGALFAAIFIFMGSYRKDETSLDELAGLMAGGAELEGLSHELEAVLPEGLT